MSRRPVDPSGAGSRWRRRAHRTYLLGVGFKGIHGALDILAAALLLAAPRLLPAGVLWAATEAGDDLGSAGTTVASALRYLGGDLLSWPGWLLGVFLLVHGLVKVASAICLLRRLLRGYPWAIAALVALLVYQVVDAAVTGSPTMAGLAVVDVAVIALVLAEYRHLRREMLESSGAPGFPEGAATAPTGQQSHLRSTTPIAQS